MKTIRKILPIEKPLCGTYPHTAHALSILMPYSQYHSWLWNSFIQIEGWDYENMDFEDFWILECPLLQHQRIGKDFIYRKYSLIGNFVQESLDMGYYVYLVLSMNDLDMYGESIGPHDVLIYGYDLRNQIYYVEDFFNGKRYGTAQISMEAFNKAVELLPESYEKHWIFYYDIILLKPKKNIKAYFSPQRVKSSLQAYLDGKQTQYWYHRSQFCYVRYNYELLYGIQTYQILYRHIDYILQEKSLLDHWNQVFYFFYEHKNTMLNRLIYMSEKGYLRKGKSYIEIYKRIKEKADYIRMAILKFYCGGHVDIRKIKEVIKRIEVEEREIIPEIINDIVVDDDKKINANGLIHKW